jgi:hypothetical protein
MVIIPFTRKNIKELKEPILFSITIQISRQVTDMENANG